MEGFAGDYALIGCRFWGWVLELGAICGVVRSWDRPYENGENLNDWEGLRRNFEWFGLMHGWGGMRVPKSVWLLYLKGRFAMGCGLRGGQSLGRAGRGAWGEVGGRVCAGESARFAVGG